MTTAVGAGNIPTAGASPFPVALAAQVAGVCAAAPTGAPSGTVPGAATAATAIRAAAIRANEEVAAQPSVAAATSANTAAATTGACAAAGSIDTKFDTVDAALILMAGSAPPARLTAEDDKPIGDAATTALDMVALAMLLQQVKVVTPAAGRSDSGSAGGGVPAGADGLLAASATPLPDAAQKLDATQQPSGAASSPVATQSSATQQPGATPQPGSAADATVLPTAVATAVADFRSPMPAFRGVRSPDNTDAAKLPGDSPGFNYVGLVQAASRDAGVVSAAPAHTAQQVVSTPVSDASWPRAIAAQVLLLATNDVQSATLKLSPEHLGPVEVHIDMQQSQVNVTFGAAQPDTRAALQQAIPDLRALLAGNGLTLGQASVQQETRQGARFAPARSRASTPAIQNVTLAPRAVSITLGLVDEYV